MTSVVDKVLAGDIRTVARLIRDIDDDVPEVQQYLKELYHHTGNAYVIGVTGSPGVGKSTLVDQLITHLRAQMKTVGALAVDPTSPFSGGAILGDRVRMQRHSTDEGVFIHSLATRGYFGGLTQSTRSAVVVLDAAGKDYIILETVGVGQDEVDVAKAAHSTIIVVTPGMGDEIQAIKAGVFEVGDIFVINKADSPEADKAVGHLSQLIALGLKKYGPDAWKPPILKTEALFDRGITDVLEQIENHAAYLKKLAGTTPLRRSKEKVEQELVEIVRYRLIQEGLKQLGQTGVFDKAVQSIVNGDMDPYTACDDLILSRLGFFKR
jgi:LAO/AO transport system kinase